MFPNSYEINGGIFIYEQVKSLAKLSKYNITVISPIPWSPHMLWFKEKWRKYGQIEEKVIMNKSGNVDGNFNGNMDVNTDDHIDSNIYGNTDGNGNKDDNIDVIYPRYICFPGKHLFFIRAITMFISVAKVIRTLMKRDDIAIIHTHTILPDGFSGALLKKFFPNIKTVCSARGSDINVYPYRNKMAMYFTRYSLRNNDIITTVSKDLMRKCLELRKKTNKRLNNRPGSELNCNSRSTVNPEVNLAANSKVGSAMNPTANCVVVYNGLKEDWFHLCGEEQIKIEELKKEYGFKTRLLFVGELSKEKGIYELILAFERLQKRYKKIGLLIVGDGRERKEFTNMCSQKDLQDKVIFFGQVKHENVKLLMRSCDIFILPSYSEGMPNVVLEVMAAGKVVIATSVGGVTEVVEHKYNGIVIKPKSVEDIVNSVELLLNDNALYNSICQNAYTTVRNKFSWNKNALQIDGIYESLLN